MSADLFAEFANNPPASQQTTSSGASGGRGQLGSQDLFALSLNGSPRGESASPIEKWPSLATPPVGASDWISRPAVTTHIAVNDEDDGWGDFETAEPTVPAASTTAALGPLGGFDSAALDSKPKVRLVRAPTIDLMTNTLVDVGQNDEASTGPKSPFHFDLGKTLESPTKSNQGNADVLFDADDFEIPGGADDDEVDNFGDFATVLPASSQQNVQTVGISNPTALLDLLSLDNPPPQLEQIEIQERPPSRPLGALSFGAQHPEPNPAPPGTASAFLERGAQVPSKSKDKDDWDPWHDMPSGDNSGKRDLSGTDAHDNWNWDAEESPAVVAILGDESLPPPTNVPPPSVILSVFPDLLTAGNALLKPLSGHNASVKQKLASAPETVKFLQGYILLATTAARVMAGRKQRWHRDKILAKSMSISAAGRKGMKLAGIDKNQSAKEDREVADVVAVWHELVGRLRSAVAAASTAGQHGLKVPELGERMLVSTAKMVPTSPKACIICGLKREERIAKVDYDVEDSFGEWWTEHWGHRSCKNFWIKHEPRLRQR